MGIRKNRSRADWEQLIREYKLHHSQESMSSFCAARLISNTTFCKWYKHLGAKSLSGNFIKLNPVVKRYSVKFLGIKLMTIESHV